VCFFQCGDALDDHPVEAVEWREVPRLDCADARYRREQKTQLRLWLAQAQEAADDTGRRTSAERLAERKSAWSVDDVGFDRI